jgi:ParB family chromosome partitioning protein
MSTVAVAYQSETAASQAVVMLALAQLREAEDNTRKTYDEASLAELAQSIASSPLGVIQPLLVRILDDDALKGQYEIVAGHRRFRAAKIAGRDTVPCIARRMSDEEAHELRILENLQREDLQPLDEAEAYQRMFSLAAAAGHPITPADVAAKIGKSESYVRLRLRVLSAEPEVRDALRSNQITVGHALEIARLDDSLQAGLLKFCLYEQWGEKREAPVSIPELRKHVAQNIMLVLADAPFDTNDAALILEAGPCTDCKKRTGNDQKLFADIEQADICTLPSCFASKVSRHIDVTIEELTAKGKPVVRLSDDYYRSSNSTDKDSLTRQQYEVIKKGAKCADTKTGVFIDGHKRGKTATVCVNGKCTVHHSHANHGSSSDDQKEKRAAARKEATVRGRIFAAIYDASSSAKLGDEHTFALAEYALNRADHNGLMKLAKLLDWPKELFRWDNKTGLRKKLEEIGVKGAVVVAMMAAVSSELSVNEYNSGKAERLEALAKMFAVSTATVRKDVDKELKAKAGKPAKAEAAPAPTPEKATKPAPKKAAKKAAPKKQKPAKKTTSKKA